MLEWNAEISPQFAGQIKVIVLMQQLRKTEVWSLRPICAVLRWRCVGQVCYKFCIVVVEHRQK